MSNIETRSLELRLENLEERTITGLAVPYGQDANIGGSYVERFAPGAIDSVEDVKLFYGHETPIGVVVAGRETDGGYEITAKVSETSLGNDVLTLMRDGALNKFSVGFIPVSQEQDGSTITRTKVSLKEVSVVPFPAYAGASITEVREEDREIVQPTEPTPTPITESESELENNIELDVRSVQDEVAELRREIATIATPTAVAAPVASFRNAGEYAKALLAREDEAVALFRAATTTSDSVVLPAFIGQINDLIVNNRPSLNSFSSAALPASGMTVEYAHVSANTLAVGVQDPENEELSFGNIAIDTVSSPVVTYGGYTSMSRQVVERSTVNFVDTAIRALAIQYAKATNAAVVAKLAALDFTGKVFDADGGTAESLIEGVAGGAAYINNATGLNPEFILCAPDAYIKMMKVVGSDGRPVVNVDGAGVNNIGSANVPGLRGQLLGLPVIVDAQLATGVVYLANSAALQTLESAGAPVRLQDADITTLTDSISVYGYIATTVPFAGAIVKLDVTA
jgi:HK97 family phage prohead protease/HK97 family phage major capsid protein